MLTFHDVSIRSGHALILEHLSVSFPQNKISVIIGPNGCGKTTLLQTLNGSSHVTAGKISLSGEDFQKLSARERARRIAFLPQSRTMIPSLPVQTVVEQGRFPHLGFGYVPAKKDKEYVKQALSFTHTSEYASLPVNTLSGGIRQRVFLAMVLAQDCEYIVLDEPTTFLDVAAQRDFYSLVHQLKAQGKTILMVLHDLSQAIKTADFLTVMSDRKIAVSGSPEECLKQHIIEDVFHVNWKRFSDSDGEYYFFE